MIDALFVGGPWDKQVRPIAIPSMKHLVPYERSTARIRNRIAVYGYAASERRGSVVLGLVYKHVEDFER